MVVNKLLPGLLALGLAACASLETSAPAGASAPVAVSVYAAGSLRGALTSIAKDYEARTGQKIALTFGASGLLRERLEQGAAAQVFASADMEHPQALANQGGWPIAPTLLLRKRKCHASEWCSCPQNSKWVRLMA